VICRNLLLNLRRRTQTRLPRMLGFRLTRW